MSENFKNKSVVVTGGNSGIGYATAKEFKDRAASVIITGRRKEKIEAAANELGVKSFLADQSDLSDLDKLVAFVKDEFGTLDILFINAGVIGDLIPIEHSYEQDFDKVMNTNLKGAYYTLSKFIPILKDGASVIFLSSVMASLNQPYNSSCCSETQHRHK